MFTGIIEAGGTLAEIKASGEGLRLAIQTPLAPAVSIGDSLAVNGVCLTVTLIDGDRLFADIGPETVGVTTLGALPRGRRVNLERPLRLDGRLAGHFVLGHVDGVGTVENIQPDGESHWITVAYDRTLAPNFIRKGSVAVDGISLTIAGLGDHQIDLQIVPFTWTHTTLQTLRVGEKVNLECDVLGKHVLRALELNAPPEIVDRAHPSPGGR